MARVIVDCDEFCQLLLTVLPVIYLFESLTCLLSLLLQRKLIYLGLEQQIAIADSLYGLSTQALPLDRKRHNSYMCSTAYIIITSHSTLK